VSPENATPSTDGSKRTPKSPACSARSSTPVHHAPAHRVGELHLAGGARRLRLGADQQVRRGLSRRRYYGGNQIIDEVEDLARERAKSLFGAEHANVQPHAGANANLGVYQALLEPATRSSPCGSTTAGT